MSLKMRDLVARWPYSSAMNTLSLRRSLVLASFTVLVATTWSPARASPSLQVDANFDSGSIGPYTIDEINDEIDFEVLSDGLSYEYWAHFTVSGVAGRTITFNLTHASDVSFLTSGAGEAQLVYSEDGASWQRFTDHALAGNTYSFTGAFTANEVRVATFFPFPVARMSDVVDTAASGPWASETVLGASHEGRDIDLLTITNPAIPTAQKKVIYSVGRQHAAETSGSHMLQGLIEFLVSDDPYAAGFRDGYVWHIAPMLNPDGVFLGSSRANAQGNDPNRDWHQNNHDSVEIDIVRAHVNAIDAADGIDIFIDWHSQMNDTGWYNFVYAPSGNAFFGILSDWTDFDTQKTPGTSCSVSSCSSRGYATGQGLFVFVMEPTPHLYTWTEESLSNEGVNTAFAINQHFGQFSGPLLVDADFELSVDTADLRADGGGPDWLESRLDDPALLTLDESNLVGNETKKARFTASSVSNAYVSQRFGVPRTGTFSVKWTILVEEILDLPGSNTDRAGCMLIGDDSDPSLPGPSSNDSERFVQMAFARDGGGTSGQTMDLVARDRDDPWNGFTTLASGLTIGQWYEVRVVCDLAAETYDVYLDDAPLGTVTSRQAKTSVSHISFAQWNDGAGGFAVDGTWTPVTAAGAVPDGNATPGTPLTVTDAGGGDIALAWDPSCLGSDTDYAIYEGLLGDFQSHAPVASPNCTTAGATNATFQPSAGSRYYLVVPQGANREGSYGTAGDGTPRPTSASACLPQLTGSCIE